jgi:NAD(P)-dependent dehydrogenase (short-subunit alcohol dehydrogenase family)
MSFEQQIVLVTGASGGIGGEVCRLLRERGATVIATDRPDRAGDSGVHLDVTSEADWERVIERTVAEHGALTGLVNIAGVFTPGIPFEDMSLAQWRRHMDVNLDGSFMGCRFAMRAMAKTGGGSIVNFSSGLAHIMLSDGVWPRRPAASTRYGSMPCCRVRSIRRCSGAIFARAWNLKP